MLFCLPNNILGGSLPSSLAACCLVPEVLISNLCEAKIVMSKCIETHWFPAAVLGDTFFPEAHMINTIKFSEEHVIIPFNDKPQFFLKFEQCCSF